MFPLSDSIAARRFPFINIALIVATSFVFFQQIAALDFEAFIYQYALVPALIDFSNYETLTPFITAMFLHGGWLHIISNMWFLWIFGDNVEGHFGWLFFPVLYFAAGIVGNLAQYLLMQSSQIPMLGASGAVAGILGAYYVLFPHAKIKTLVPVFGFVSIINIAAPFMLGYWFILQVFSGAISLPFSGESGGIAFWAHAGGFLTGVVFANLFKGSGDRLDRLL